MIILLNGTSSSGKSSTVDSLSQKLTTPYFVFGVDRFLEHSMPLRLNMDVSEDLKIIDRSISALNEAVGIYAKHVDHLIIDHVLQHPNWIGEIADSLFNFDVLFVGLTAPLSVIEERESRRANRQPGTARAQFEQMQKYEYDLLIDTSVLSPDEIADKIIANLVPGSTLKKYARINFYLLPP